MTRAAEQDDGINLAPPGHNFPSVATGEAFVAQ